MNAIDPPGGRNRFVAQGQGGLRGVECKRTDAPKMTPSIRSALEDLQLESISIVYPGNKRFKLAEQVEAVPLMALTDEGVFTK